jgi:hypothetical protein
VTITGGDKTTCEGPWEWRVPKRDLISGLVVALQGGRLRWAAGLPAAATLEAELLDVRVKISQDGHDSYGAWREGQHDDLVLAVALAVWAAQRPLKRPAVL